MAKLRLPEQVRGFITLDLLIIGLLLAATVFYSLAIFKLFMPFRSWRNRWTDVLMAVKQFWVGYNRRVFMLMLDTQWSISLPPGLQRDKSYMVISNHVLATDIFVAWQVLNRRIPTLRFFLKREILYIPIVGWACWAMDFPFMKRYSKNYLIKHPEKRGEDMQTTKDRCKRFEHSNVSVMNYCEGTRITPEKHRNSHSPYRHLLKPKAGGTALVLDAMGDYFDCVLDITLVYISDLPAPSLWDFWCGRIDKIIVRVDRLEIPRGRIHGDYVNDFAFQRQFQEWVTDVWVKKDKKIAKIRNIHNRPDPLIKSPQSE